MAAVLMGSILIVMPKWQKLIGLGVGYWVILRFGYKDAALWPLHATAYLGLLLAASVQIAQQWERGVVLRLGKFRALKGPGFFMIFPLIFSPASFFACFSCAAVGKRRSTLAGAFAAHTTRPRRLAGRPSLDSGRPLGATFWRSSPAAQKAFPQ